MTATAVVSPSLALTKYWGKAPGGTNLPATSSLAVSLGALTTTTTVRTPPSGAERDHIVIDGAECEPDPFLPVLDAVRSAANSDARVAVHSASNFPAAAGLASSSSGLAAMALATNGHLEAGLSATELSSIARVGSGSAARAVFGGFTTWRAGEPWAEQFAGSDHWPELRVVIVIVRSERKSVSSRDAMGRARETSPFYDEWVRTSEELFSRASQALGDRDLNSLGAAMRESYLRMFGTMFSSQPPLVYWMPESVAVIRLCEELRSSGIPAWETMDAGPQVKLLIEAANLREVTRALEKRVPQATIVTSVVGDTPRVTVASS